MQVIVKNKERTLYYEKLNKPGNDKNLLNNLNEIFIQIDYFDQKGIKKYKNKIPLSFILNSNINNQTSV